MEGPEGGAGGTRWDGRAGGARPTSLDDFLPQCPEELQPLLRVPPPVSAAAAAAPLAVHLQRLQPLGELHLELQRVAAEACARQAVSPAAAATAAGCWPLPRERLLAVRTLQHLLACRVAQRLAGRWSPAVGRPRVGLPEDVARLWRGGWLELEGGRRWARG